MGASQVGAPAKTLSVWLGLKINRRVKWKIDETPDLDNLGKYVDQHEEGAIDRKKEGDCRSGECRYFVSENNSVYRKKDWDHVDGKTKADLIRKHGSLANVTRHYAKQDYERMESYNRGEWHMRGCVVSVRYGSLRAEASVWGVESDCGDDYERELIRDLTRDAMRELRGKLMKRLEIE